MRENKVRKSLKSGTAVIGTMITEIATPAFPAILADAGFDFLTLDMEHGAFDFSAAAYLFQIARLVNIVPLVRVPEGLYHLIAPALDAGAMGVIVPRVEKRDVAERSVAAMRYPPIGVRGVFTGKANNDYKTARLLDYARHANDNVLAIIQIESKAAVECADELLATPGLDGVMVGPWDLALSLGVEPDDPLVEDLAQKVVDAAYRQNVASGIHVGDPAQIKKWQSRGMTFLSCLSDLEILRNSVQALAQTVRES